MTFRDQQFTLKQIKDLIETYQYKIKNKNEEQFVFTLKTATSHGNFYELISTFLKSAINIEGNVAADLIIPVGTVTFSQKDQSVQKELMGLSNQIASTLSSNFYERQEKTIENFENMADHEKKVSGTISDTIKEYEDTLTQSGLTGESFFIAHESTKLYKGAEQVNGTFKDFHGRQMNILSALSKLYASNNLSSSMINPQRLMTYLINIDPVTLAGNANKQPLETYLSLFAGLLMFDDIKDIADGGINTVINEFTGTTIDSIHVYNIGGIYFPVSVILNDLISQMTEIVQSLDINNSKTATAVIKGPTPSLPTDITQASWSAVANSTLAGTTIQIHFLSGFMDYVEQLNGIF